MTDRAASVTYAEVLSKYLCMHRDISSCYQITSITAMTIVQGEHVHTCRLSVGLGADRGLWAVRSQLISVINPAVHCHYITYITLHYMA